MVHGGASAGTAHHGSPAVEMARALVTARTDIARARDAARRAMRERLREHMSGGGHGVPMPALREELRRYGRRMARLARVREVAEVAQDADSLTRADKLIDSEQGRHERWMGKHGSSPATEGGAP